MADGSAQSATVSDPLTEAGRRGMQISFHAVEDANRPAIVSLHGDRTYGELNANANRLVRALRRRGLALGDAVAILCGNRPEFAEVYAAVQRGGFRLTTINWHLTPGEAGYIVDDCEAKAFVADCRYADTAGAALAEAPGCGVTLAVGGPIEGFERYEDVLAPEDGSDIDDAEHGTSMLYTSGTTGRPKGVKRQAVPVPPATTRATYGYIAGEDVNLCTGPLYHAAPLAFNLAAPLSAGVTVVLMDGWDPEETLRLIEAHRVTHTHMVPTMFHRLLSLPDDVKAKYDVSSLRSILHGAAPCPVAVKQALMDWLGPIVHEYYAATEGAGTTVDPQTWLARPGTVGKPADPDHVKIQDDDGNELPAGEIGLVYLKAPQVGRFQYFKDEKKTQSSYRGDYFTLGDMGYLDTDGYLFLTDRTANLIISGGVNIYPAEVDAVLLTHPAVRDVATIGVPNDEWGEEVKAVVELKDGHEPTTELAAELIGLARDRLAHYKCPRTVDFTDSLPREDNGKIYKRRLRDQYRERMANGDL